MLLLLMKKTPVVNKNFITTGSTHTESHQGIDLGRLSNKIVAAKLQAAVLDRVQQQAVCVCIDSAILDHINVICCFTYHQKVTPTAK